MIRALFARLRPTLTPQQAWDRAVTELHAMEADPDYGAYPGDEADARALYRQGCLAQAPEELAAIAHQLYDVARRTRGAYSAIL